MFKPQTSLVSNKRTGFTLVELLVVIAIIAILAAVSAGVVIKFFGAQKNNTTENTVKLLQTAVDRVVNNIHRRSQQDFNILPGGQKTIYDNLAISLGTVIGVREPARRQMVVYQNIQLFRNFPKIKGEIDTITKTTFPVKNTFWPLYPSTLEFVPTIKKKVYELIVTEGGDFTQLSDSEANSALLLLALESNADGLKREDLGSALTFKSKIPFIVTASTDPIQFKFKVNQDPSSNASALKGAYSIEFIY
jgi:prepilin-type N-terminal cleavage/methylation domain-containing protein